MIYSPLVKKASLIAFKAHKKDLDKGGYPYIMHPVFIASKADTEYEACVALLHDVVEDHGNKYSLNYLYSEGFPEEIVEAVDLLTKDKNMDYMEYIKKIKENELATKVKIKDLLHNLDYTRLGGKENKKEDIYLKALKYLMED